MHEAVIFSCGVIIIVRLVGGEKLLCSLWRPFPHPKVQVGPAVNRTDNKHAIGPILNYSIIIVSIQP